MWLNMKKSLEYTGFRDPRTIRKMFSDGLKYSVVNGRVRVHTSDIDTFMRSQQPGPDGAVQREASAVLKRAGLGDG